MSTQNIILLPDSDGRTRVQISGSGFGLGPYPETREKSTLFGGKGA